MSCPEPLGLPPFVLRMVWHRQRENDPAHVWLRKLIATELGAQKTMHPDK
jgi:DNA-binding transcriptional LysR family regulator